jgi:hypothetical protein
MSYVIVPLVLNTCQKTRLTTVDPFVSFASALFVDGPRQSRRKIGQPRADWISETWREQRSLNFVTTSLEVLRVSPANRLTNLFNAQL